MSVIKRLLSLPILLIQWFNQFIEWISLPITVAMTLVTLPGLVLATWLRGYICYRSGVRVDRLILLRMGWPPSVLDHVPPSSIGQALAVVLGPWIILSLSALVLLLPARLAQQLGQDALFALLLWLGLSIGAHSLPDRENVNAIWSQGVLGVRNRNWWALLGFPLAVLLYGVLIIDSKSPLPLSLWPLLLWLFAYVIPTTPTG